MNIDQLESKINNCWKGKSIGAELGLPFQEMKQVIELGDCPQTPVNVFSSSALDQQFVWLHALEAYGPLGITRQRLAECWVSYMPPVWAANTIGIANLQVGISPALSGKHQNPWKQSNSAWARAEIWACCTPGRPDLAAEYAYMDACIDHGDGEGVYGEIFIAALESAAFAEESTETVLEAALSYLPPSSKVQQSVQIVLNGYRNRLGWKKVREEVVEAFADTDLMLSPVNIAFVVIGLLYGEMDFDRAIYTAISCGGDAVNTAAAIGAVMAILTNQIPRHYNIEEKIQCKLISVGAMPHLPMTFAELTNRVMTIGAQVKLAFSAAVSTTAAGKMPASETKGPKGLAKILDHEADAVFDFLHSSVQIHYASGINISPDQTITLELTVTNQTETPLNYELSYFMPDGCMILTAPTYLRVNTKTRLTDDSEIIMVMLKTGDIVQAKNRGIIQMIAQGRPTVILIPFLFFGA